MKQFTDSIRMSVSTGNWFGALFMTLAVPDICAALENGSTTGALYKNWYDRYLKPTYNPDPITTREELVQYKIKSYGVERNGPAITDIRKKVSALPEAEFMSEIGNLNRGAPLWGFSADDCYRFRCKSLHEGLAQRSNSKAIQFSPPNQRIVSIHRCILNGVYTIDISVFCEDMCTAVEQWLIDKANDAVVQRRISELMSLDNPIPGVHNNFEMGTR